MKFPTSCINNYENIHENEKRRSKRTTSQFRPFPTEIVSSKNISRNWDSPQRIGTALPKLVLRKRRSPGKIRKNGTLAVHTQFDAERENSSGLQYLEFIFHLIAKLPSVCSIFAPRLSLFVLQLIFPWLCARCVDKFSKDRFRMKTLKRRFQIKGGGGTAK